MITHNCTFISCDGNCDAELILFESEASDAEAVRTLLEKNNWISTGYDEDEHFCPSCAREGEPPEKHNEDQEER